MILTTVILVLLIGCWVNGTNRGLLGMLISTCTYLISWLAAKVGARFLGGALAEFLPQIGSNTTGSVSGSLLSSIDPTSFFYNGLAFMIIFSMISFFGHWLLKRTNWLNRLPVLGSANRWAGGALDVLVGYLIIFMFLMIFQLFPSQWWQDQLAQSGIAQLMIRDTPGMAKAALQLLG